jgi:hypothetical protein
MAKERGLSPAGGLAVLVSRLEADDRVQAKKVGVRSLLLWS